MHKSLASLSGKSATLIRPKLNALVAEALQKPLTCVVAGAGYGKTFAISTVLEGGHHPYAFIQLSDLDNMIAILWRRLLISLSGAHPILSARLGVLGFPYTPSAFFQFLHTLGEELPKKDPFILVFDDFHLIRDGAVLDFLEKLITAQVPSLHIALLTREKPQIALSAMLSKGLMTRITEDDLRFTLEEMQAYYALSGETLSTATLHGLYHYTEGWAFAIYLTGLSLKKQGARKESLFAMTRADIYDLIETEIYHAASPALQDFLAILARLETPPSALLKELTAQTPDILREMVGLSLLIRYDGGADRYRMHQLFREYLLEKTAHLPPAQMEAAHLIAAKWYRDNDQPEAAVRHFAKCGRYEDIFHISTHMASRRVPGNVAELYIHAIDSAPKDLIDAYPLIRVVRAQYLFNNNRLAEAKAALHALVSEYEAMEPGKDRDRILGEAYILLGLIAIVSHSEAFVSYFQKAHTCLPGGSALIDASFPIAEGINVVGIQDAAPGGLKKHQEALYKVAPFASHVMNGCGYGLESLHAADAAYMKGDMQVAEKNAFEAIYKAETQAQHSIVYMASFYLLRIYLFKGDYSRIEKLLEEMKSRLEALQSTACMTLYDIIEGWFNVKVGHPEKVSQWILYEEETRKLMAPVILGREYLVRSDCLLSLSRDYELLGFIKTADAFFTERGILYGLLQNRITESIVQHYLGNHRESMEALRAAHALSSGNGLITPYTEYGNKMRAVVAAALKNGDSDLPEDFLEVIQKKSSTYAKRLAIVQKEHNQQLPMDAKDQVGLSRREKEILTCLCQGLTRDEIADSCALSASTINSMMQNIFNKLGAFNSLDAVRIAIQMRLV